MNNPSLIRQIKNTLRRTWDGLWTTGDATVVKTGGASPWWIKTDLLFPGAVVISGGAGKDVSFEKELAGRYGCRVFIFDPSPTGLETMSHQENQHQRIKYFPLGLAASIGDQAFNLPQDPSEGSYSLVRKSAKTGATSFGCTTVSEFVRSQGIEQIDVLKLDIEGFEYGVLQDVLDAKLQITQICVEFHHFLPGIRIGQTLHCLWRLRRRGFILRHKEMCDYLFVARSELNE